MNQVPVTTSNASRPGAIANHRLTAATAAVAAQPIDEKASAKVATRERDNDGREQGKAYGEHRDEWERLAERGARRPPQDAVDAGRVRQRRRRPRHRSPRQRPVGEDRRLLQADDEGGAATTCAMSRMRFGPISRNMATVRATASAVAAEPIARMSA